MPINTDDTPGGIRVSPPRVFRCFCYIGAKVLRGLADRGGLLGAAAADRSGPNTTKAEPEQLATTCKLPITSHSEVKPCDTEAIPLYISFTKPCVRRVQETSGEHEERRGWWAAGAGETSRRSLGHGAVV